MSLLVTGAKGFVGRRLSNMLTRQGLPVRLVTRSNDAELAQGDVIDVGDINGLTNWVDALCGVDVVIHLAARVHMMNDIAKDPLAEFRKTNVDGTLNFALQAARAGVKRFIFISSVKVNGEQTVRNRPFVETNVANPVDAYGISKLEAENGLMLISEQTDMEVVIIRPPLVYGAGVKANFANMMQAVQKGLSLPFGAIHNKRSFVYVENLVSLILLCIDHPAAANQVFLVSDGHDLSTTELLLGCANALGVKARLLPIPQKLIELGLVFLGKREMVQRLCGNLQVDITKARTLLGWTPPFSVEEGLKVTALDFTQAKKQ